MNISKYVYIIFNGAFKISSLLYADKGVFSCSFCVVKYILERENSSLSDGS